MVFIHNVLENSTNTLIDSSITMSSNGVKKLTSFLILIILIVQIMQKLIIYFSKILIGANEGKLLNVIDDRNPMHTAVAFYSTIRESCKIRGVFNKYSKKYCEKLSETESLKTANIRVRHIDSYTKVNDRSKETQWLKDTPKDGNECREC